MSDSLIEALPDLVTFVRRDGVITAHLGGRHLSSKPDLGQLVGRRIEEVWPEAIAQRLRHMIRKALASRINIESVCVDGAVSYEARVRPQGRERVLCVIREIVDGDSTPRVRATGDARPTGGGGMERRGFTQRMQRSIADAALRERPLALCMIHLGGLADIARSIDFTIADRVATAALQHLPACSEHAAASGLGWYSGQLAEEIIAVVIEGAETRDALRATVRSICDALQTPVEIGDASFQLAACAGVAILGEDAAQPQALFEHARAALAEARRTGAGALQFYSDTLRMLPAMRMDLERELRNAIAAHEIQLRHVGRYDLSSGQLVAVQAYLRWSHPLRGDVPPTEFLAIAASTGLAIALSRCALSQFLQDVQSLRAVVGETVTFSFGPLRHHLVSGALVKDLEAALGVRGLKPGMLELRIAEKTLASLGRADRIVAQLNALGAGIMLDEFGRGFSSLARLAALPLKALQLDRRFVLAAAQRPSARRFCQAAVAVARANALIPIAAGIDSDSTRQQMLQLGCEQGLGDHFAPLGIALPAASAVEPVVAIAS